MAETCKLEKMLILTFSDSEETTGNGNLTPLGLSAVFGGGAREIFHGGALS